MKRLVFVLGMEPYNAEFFYSIKKQFESLCPAVALDVFYDQELLDNHAAVDAAIAQCDAVFSALMVIDDSASALLELLNKHSPEFVFSFESLPALMKRNKVGAYHFSEKGEMPKPVKALGKMLGGGKDEDAFYGYVQMQKLANRVMKFLPESFGGEKVRDARTWMTVSSYWSNSGEENILNMLLYIADKLFHIKTTHDAPKEITTMGFYHPDYFAQSTSFFPDLHSFQKWEKKTGRDKGDKPKVGLLLPRKHLLSGTGYAADVIRAMEAEGLRVYPCFAMGIELHIVTRSWLKEAGVEALINLFGFPLVGGPAGSTSTGIANPAASDILSSMNAPYIVSQPLFIQTKESWREHGVNPIQSMIVYSLPEMDGAICPVVLGALEGDKLKTESTRLNRLTKLVKRWVALKHKANRDKKVAIVLYNYPPNQGKLGTAALLNVPQSLVNTMKSLQQEGYNVGDFFLRYAVEPEQLTRDLAATLSIDGKPITATMRQYHQWVSPKAQERIEARWGNAPGDISVANSETFIIGGLQFGNIYIGAQPQLFIQGDPMRLLFDKENTPHHQFVMFYKWITNGFGADALIHFGMHGTAEWMPGLQLGLTDDCWSDMLLGDLPQFYVYPMNNPSEANIAKRRGYATIISHAIPPYARAGLYREFQALRDLLDDYRTGRDSADLREAILQKAALLNLNDDVPPQSDFERYACDLMNCLKEMENRLICGDLHTLGATPDKETQTELVAETLKNQSELAFLNLASDLLHTEPYSLLVKKSREGDEAALAAKQRVDAFCAQIVSDYIVGGKPLEPTAFNVKM